MRAIGFFAVAWSGVVLCCAEVPAEEGKVAIAVHGGAGSPISKAFFRDHEGEYRETMRRSLEAGHLILEGGGRSLDAVQAAIVVLEDSSLFNAGKGAVFTEEGRNELDASIMDGRTFRAGAVGGVTTVKNPILAARAVMDKTWHVLLAGDGAERFAKEQGLEIVAPDYFRTEERWKRYLEGRGGKKQAAGHGAAADHFGTVGAGALDREGHLAAGTSTGGLMHKKPGRLGDTPIVGAGTYAEDATCAISATGQGEYLMRRPIAFDIAARMKYAGQSLEAPARAAIQEALRKDGGSGGVIGLDGKGTIVAEHNTPAMVRGWVDTNGEVVIAF